MKIVINTDWGGFGISGTGAQKLIEWGMPKAVAESLRENNRSHPLLVRLVEELGVLANGNYSKLKVVEIPDDIEWEIEEYDGVEWVAEKHRTWR